MSANKTVHGRRKRHYNQKLRFHRTGAVSYTHLDVYKRQTISTGSSKVDVPTTLGKTEAAARTELEAAGFKVTVEETENTDKSDGIVLKQSITGKADPGTTITITVNKITKPTEATVTIDVSKYVSQTTEDDNTNETDNTCLLYTSRCV